jgi:hypothetical protein
MCPYCFVISHQPVIPSSVFVFLNTNTHVYSLLHSKHTKVSDEAKVVSEELQSKFNVISAFNPRKVPNSSSSSSPSLSLDPQLQEIFTRRLSISGVSSDEAKSPLHENRNVSNTSISSNSPAPYIPVGFKASAQPNPQPKPLSQTQTSSAGKATEELTAKLEQRRLSINSNTIAFVDKPKASSNSRSNSDGMDPQLKAMLERRRAAKD